MASVTDRPLGRSAVAVVLVTGLAATAVSTDTGQASPAEPATSLAKASNQARLKLLGAEPESVSMCGRSRRTFVAAAGARVRASVRIHGRARATRPRLIRQRCEAGSWQPISRQKLGRKRGSGKRRFLREIDTADPGQFRLRAKMKSRSDRAVRSRWAYLELRPRAPSGSGPVPEVPEVRDVLDVPVSFSVTNTNTSDLPCASDGLQYRLSGRLIGPESALTGAGPVAGTLYLHEFTFGKFFWRFPPPGGDYVGDQAGDGHVSVIIDRLGYDESPGPQGIQTCIGAHADMAHQVVSQLRAGSYSSPQLVAPRFARLALAGHSVGGAISELETYSYDDVDALLLFAWADQGFSARSIQESLVQGAICTAGGEPAEPGGPGGYAYFGQSDQDFRDVYFHNAEPAIVEAALAMRNRDPCGDAASQTNVIALNNLSVSQITVPTLLLYGLNDDVFGQPAAGEQQEAMFTGSSDVTTVIVDDTGHAITLERTAPTTRRIVSGWLAARGF